MSRRAADPLTEAIRGVMARFPRMSPQEAVRIVADEEPGLISEWHRGSAGPEPDPLAEDSSGAGPAEGTDPGALLVQLGQALHGAGEVATFAAGFRLACDRYPTLSQAYHAGQYLPSSQYLPSTQGQRAAIEQFAGAGLEPGRVTRRPHYLELPRAEQLRRLHAGEQPGPGATLVHKLSAGPEGGFYEVLS